MGAEANSRSHQRNETRKEFRLENPEHRGKQLKKWPIERNLVDMEQKQTGGIKKKKKS